MLALLLSMLSCFVLLLFIGLEGIICVLMASPILLVGAAVGAVIGTLASTFGNRMSNFFIPTFAAVSVLLGGQVEDALAPSDRLEEVITTCTVAATPAEVWDALLTMDAVEAPQPLLLRIGLPVPERCTLDGSGVGARRVCYFDSGSIEERITGWEPQRRFEMLVTDCTLPGRHWLHFLSASYSLKEISPGRTEVTRTTVISSKLRPAWYWQWFERMGVEAEHQYLFDSLTRSLQNKR
jgi:hypothetical protein